MKSLLLGSFVVATVALAGCGKKADKPGEGSAAPVGSSAPASASGSGSGSAAAVAAGSDAPATGSAAPASAEADVPVESDFEEEAAAKVTAANLDAELTALEKELAQ